MIWHFSPRQLKVLQEMVQARRVLELVDEDGKPLAPGFAHLAKAWTVVGRMPPSSSLLSSQAVILVADTFERSRFYPAPYHYEIVVLPFPSPRTGQDAHCLEWAIPEHQIVFFGHPREDAACGSPAFWKLFDTVVVERDERDLWSRMLVMRKMASSLDGTPDDEDRFGPPYPRMGERYRLAQSYHWPGKKHGDKAPVVVILKDWVNHCGSARIVDGDEILPLRTYDLGSRL